MVKSFLRLIIKTPPQIVEEFFLLFIKIYLLNKRLGRGADSVGSAPLVLYLFQVDGPAYGQQSDAVPANHLRGQVYKISALPLCGLWLESSLPVRQAFEEAWVGHLAELIRAQ
mgnify:CR=1 FL=1